MSWAAFEQSGLGATPGMGISTLIGSGNLEPLGADLPAVGAPNVVLTVHSIGGGIADAVISRASDDVSLSVVGGTAKFVESVGGPTVPGAEIAGSGFFNASDHTCPADWWILGVSPVTGFIVAAGGVVTIDGNFKIHTFNGSGVFQVTSGSGVGEVLVVGGGAGGGNADQNSFGAGGGAAGGIVYDVAYPLSIGSYPVVVGAGGGGGNPVGTSGGNSVFDTMVPALGGGGGGAGSAANAGANGGCGGGSSGGASVGVGSQGGNGGMGDATGPNSGGGGGGGDGANGVAGSNVAGGSGGPGTMYFISGSLVTYAGGGGGGTFNGGTAGAGGSGGGGAGGNADNGVAGVANLGGGGGGAGSVSV